MTILFALFSQHPDYESFLLSERDVSAELNAKSAALFTLNSKSMLKCALDVSKRRDNGFYTVFY